MNNMTEREHHMLDKHCFSMKYATNPFFENVHGVSIIPGVILPSVTMWYLSVEGVPS
jgi:hypothetical protein